MLKQIEQNHQTSESGSNEVIVIKLDKSACESDSTLAPIVRKVGTLLKTGAKIVIVHETGLQTTEYLNAHDLKPKFIDGMQVFDGDTLMANLSGLAHVNDTLTAMLHEAGIKAVGLCAEPNLLACKKKLGKSIFGKSVDLGWAGDIVSTNAISLIEHLQSVVVVSPIGKDKNKNRFLLDGEQTAFALASALDAKSLVHMSVDGAIVSSTAETHAINVLKHSLKLSA